MPGQVGVCEFGSLSNLGQTEEVFKIHTYKPMIFAKRGVYVLSEDCNSMGNLSLYLGVKKTYLQANLGNIGVNIHPRCVF